MVKQSWFLVVDACARAYAVFNRLQQSLSDLARTCHTLPELSITLSELCRNFARACRYFARACRNFATSRSGQQNSAEFICRVFHRDILTVTGLVPLHILLPTARPAISLIKYLLVYIHCQKLIRQDILTKTIAIS